MINRYDKSTGVESASLDLTNFTDPIVKSFTVDENGKFIGTGYDNAPTASPTSDDSFVFRVLADLSAVDTTFNTTGIQTYKISPTSTVRSWNDLMVTLEGKMIAVGFVTVFGVETPYLIRLYGDVFADQVTYPISAGAVGTLDPTFATSGTFDLESLDGSLTDIAASSILAPSTGGNYIAFDNGSTASKLIKITNDTVLDSSYNTNGIAVDAPQGIYSSLLDGLGRIILTGTDGSGGWIQRYTTNGILDTSFATTGLISSLPGIATSVVEQTLGRIVFAGKDTSFGVLRGYRLTGVIDPLFGTNGVYSTGVGTGIYTLVADQFDRLIIAYQNGTNCDIARLTSNGELDLLFGSSGVVASAIADVDQEAQVRAVVDAADNIIVVTHVSTGGGQIAIKAYDTDGVVVSGYSQLNITTLTSPTLTDVAATSDGKIIVSGYQSGNNAMWAAQITSTGILDTTFGVDGILSFTIAAGVQTSRILSSCAVRYDGRLAFVGSEIVSGTTTPFLVRAYSNPYALEEVQSFGDKPAGTNDLTFGLTGDDGLLFYALDGTGAAQQQVARAVAMQTNSKILVACDGQDLSSTSSRIFLNEFTIDGTLDTTFNTTGQVELPTSYDHEYVRDMITFTTVDGVHKAIIAGYVTSNTLGVNSSLLLQYNLDSENMDTTFGGLYHYQLQ